MVIESMTAGGMMVVVAVVVEEGSMEDERLGGSPALAGRRERERGGMLARNDDENDEDDKEEVEVDADIEKRLLELTFKPKDDMTDGAADADADAIVTAHLREAQVIVGVPLIEGEEEEMAVAVAANFSVSTTFVVEDVYMVGVVEEAVSLLGRELASEGGSSDGVAEAMFAASVFTVGVLLSTKSFSASGVRDGASFKRAPGEEDGDSGLSEAEALG